MRFKHLMLLVLAAMSLVACNNQKDTQWEYKIIRISENDGKTLQEAAQNIANRSYGIYGPDAKMPIPYIDPTVQINELGKQGWELVNVYTTTETVFPNFGSEEYHTGIKENTRTQSVNFVFKRQIKDVSKDKPKDTATTLNSDTSDTIIAVDVTEFADTCGYD